MKKMIIAALMMLASAATFAQVSIKPMVGVSGSNITNFDEATMKVGAIAGVEVEKPINDMFSVSAGALFAMEGTKFDVTAFGKTGTMKANLNYINVPVLVNAYVAPGLAVKLGVQPGFNISNSIKFEANGHSEKAKIGDGVNTFDLAMPIGLSYEISDIVIDARYNFGLTKVFKNADDSYKNSVFQLTLGYKF